MGCQERRREGWLVAAAPAAELQGGPEAKEATMVCSSPHEIPNSIRSV